MKNKKRIKFLTKDCKIKINYEKKEKQNKMEAKLKLNVGENVGDLFVEFILLEAN